MNATFINQKIPMIKVKNNESTIVLIMYFLLAFPLFYFVYKFSDPKMGANDFFDYYPLYKDWDHGKLETPFNMRLIGPYFVYLMNKLGLHYDTVTVFDKYGLERHVYFNATFFNFICTVLTSALLFRLVFGITGSTEQGFIAGLIYLLGFGTIFFELAAITDAFSLLIFSFIFIGYLKENKFIFVLLAILILQREYIFLAFGLYSFFDYLHGKKGFHLATFICCVVCLGIYYFLRMTVFHTPKYDFQVSPGSYYTNLFSIKFSIMAFIKQLAMTLNLYWIYTGLILYKIYKKAKVDSFIYLKVLLLIFQIVFLSFAAVLGNNAGRYLYMMTPIIIYAIFVEVKTLKTLSN